MQIGPRGQFQYRKRKTVQQCVQWSVTVIEFSVESLPLGNLPSQMQMLELIVVHAFPKDRDEGDGRQNGDDHLQGTQ